ncbi:hypothetical protein BZL29_7923 [Mycobacterium kansasii]|uniref:Uncharacterized protein n=1 Tax=Mycobacterium kansasii TaxID=1768 RepID=A0A1V3WE45_MYCKA|nr:hypothetical protein BZL29_7923 [Mycobacterium kansasii]
MSSWWAIEEDYRSGFGEVLDALNSGRGLEETTQRLKVIRRRKITGRSGLDVIVRKLKADKALFNTSRDGPLVSYVEAAQAFKRSDQPLDGDATWYSQYISEFNRLIEEGKDPHRRENYPSISGARAAGTTGGPNRRDRRQTDSEKVGGIHDRLRGPPKRRLGNELATQTSTEAATRLPVGRKIHLWLGGRRSCLRCCLRSPSPRLR